MINIVLFGDDAYKARIFIFSYADDLVVICDSNQYQQLKINHALNVISDITRRLGMVINKSKSKAMWFMRGGMKKLNEETKVFVQGKQLEMVKSYKYLGINFDCKLNFGLHIDDIKKKVVSRFNMMKKLAGTKWGADAFALQTFYTAAIRSHMDYGSQVFTFSTTTRLKVLQIVQNRALRLIMGTSLNAPVSAMHFELQIEPLQERRERLLANYLSKFKARGEDHPLFKNFNNCWDFDVSLLRRPDWRHKAADIFRQQGNLVDISKNVINIIEPWACITPIVDISQPKTSKKQNSDVILKSWALEKLDKYDKINNSMHVFTDGSVGEGGRLVGAAWVIPKEFEYEQIRLPAGSSILQAEMAAITHALVHIQNKMEVKNQF